SDVCSSDLECFLAQARIRPQLECWVTTWLYRHRRDRGGVCTSPSFLPPPPSASRPVEYPCRCAGRHMGVAPLLAIHRIHLAPPRESPRLQPRGTAGRP